MGHREEFIARETIYEGCILSLHRDKVRLENGGEAFREIIEHSGGVAVLASPDGENILLVRQYRHAAGSELLELPAGKLEKGEEPALCALRELEEETGYRAQRVEFLGRYYATPGYDAEVLHLYRAYGLTPAAQALDADEFLSVVQMPCGEALAAVRDGRIIDAKTALALLLAGEL
jgi:ADP-ribose pyrophosphatase